MQKLSSFLSYYNQIELIMAETMIIPKIHGKAGISSLLYALSHHLKAWGGDSGPMAGYSMIS